MGWRTVAKPNSEDEAKAICESLDKEQGHLPTTGPRGNPIIDGQFNYCQDSLGVWKVKRWVVDRI